ARNVLRPPRGVDPQDAVAGGVSEVDVARLIHGNFLRPPGHRRPRRIRGLRLAAPGGRARAIGGSATAFACPQGKEGNRLKNQYPDQQRNAEPRTCPRHWRWSFGGAPVWMNHFATSPPSSCPNVCLPSIDAA